MQNVSLIVFVFVFSFSIATNIFVKIFAKQFLVEKLKIVRNKGIDKCLNERVRT